MHLLGSWCFLFIRLGPHCSGACTGTLPQSNSWRNHQQNWKAVRYYIQKGHKRAMAAPCCQGGENAVLLLPRSPWAVEVVLVSSLGGSAGCVPLWNTDADVWKVCVHQLLIFKYHMVSSKPNKYTAASRGWSEVFQNKFNQRVVRWQHEVAQWQSPSFPSSYVWDEVQKSVCNFFLSQGLHVCQQLCFVDGAKCWVEQL